MVVVRVWPIVASAVVFVLMFLFAVAPISGLHSYKIALADALLEVGQAGLARRLLRANAGDPDTLNNLAVLNYYDAGEHGHRQHVLRDLRQAALQGSATASDNLIHFVIGRCLHKTERSKTSLQELLLPLIDAGNRDAGDFLERCMAVRQAVQERSRNRRFCELVDHLARLSGNGLRLFIAARICAHEATHAPAGRSSASAADVARAYGLAFLAIESGEVDGYLIFADHHGLFLLQAADRYQVEGRFSEKTRTRWLLEGGSNGCWRCLCYAAQETFFRYGDEAQLKELPAAKAVELAKKCQNMARARDRSFWRRESAYRIFHKSPADFLPATGHLMELTIAKYRSFRFRYLQKSN